MEVVNSRWSLHTSRKAEAVCLKHGSWQLRFAVACRPLGWSAQCTLFRSPVLVSFKFVFLFSAQPYLYVFPLHLHASLLGLYTSLLCTNTPFYHRISQIGLPRHPNWLINNQVYWCVESPSNFIQLICEQHETEERETASDRKRDLHTPLSPAIPEIWLMTS